MNQKKKTVDGIKRNTKKVSRTRADTSFVHKTAQSSGLDIKVKSSTGVTHKKPRPQDSIVAKKVYQQVVLKGDREVPKGHSKSSYVRIADRDQLVLKTDANELSKRVGSDPKEYLKGSSKRQKEKTKAETLLRVLVSRPVRFTALFIGVVILFNYLSYTDIKLRSRIHSVIVSEVDTAYLYPERNQLGFDIIAVTAKEKLSFTSTATKRQDSFATGSVRLFNNFSTAPQRLLPNTRLESADGSIYVTPDVEVIIPGKVGDSPGSTDVRVTARESGSAFNIDVTDFVIPGFRELGLDDKYAGVYGVSTSSFSGGGTDLLPVLDDATKIRAKDTLRVQLAEKLKKRLVAEKTEKFFLVNNSFSVSNISFDEQVSGANIRIEGSATATGIILSKELLTEYLNERNIFESDTPLIIDGYRDIDISLLGQETNVLEKNNLDIRLEFTVLYRNMVSQDWFTGKYLNKTKDELVQLVDQEKDFDYIRVNTFPFWKKKTVDSLDDLRFEIDDEDLLL